MDLNWIKLLSSHLNATAYDEYGVLHIRFNNGDEYIYHDVTYDIFEDLCKASSPGKYFHSFIRNNYKSEKI
jgi:hypothetical protein